MYIYVYVCICINIDVYEKNIHSAEGVGSTRRIGRCSCTRGSGVPSGVPCATRTPLPSLPPPR